MSLNISRHFFESSAAEAIVLRQAMKNGLVVSLPFGGGVPYDMIVQNPLGKLYTVQVKKVGIVVRGRPYKIIHVLRSVTVGKKTQYKLGDTDFFIACDIDTD